MNLFNLSNLGKPVLKLGNAIVMTVAPVASVLEMANETANALALSHSADVQAKTERDAAVRVSTHSKLLRKALADAQRSLLEVSSYERDVQALVVQDAHDDRIHRVKMARLANISDEEIEALSYKNTVTSKDIVRATTEAPEVAEVPDTFALSQFTLRS
jgi:hypothetical protein